VVTARSSAHFSRLFHEALSCLTQAANPLIPLSSFPGPPLYFHGTGTETKSTVMKFMLDDKTVATSDWTHVENIGLIRD